MSRHPPFALSDYPDMSEDTSESLWSSLSPKTDSSKNVFEIMRTYFCEYVHIKKYSIKLPLHCYTLQLSKCFFPCFSVRIVISSQSSHNFHKAGIRIIG